MLVYSKGYTSWATPTIVELVSNGVAIYGAFGDVSNCGEPNVFFIHKDDPRYSHAYSMALAALAGKKEMRFYSSKCTSVPFHWSGNKINTNVNTQSIYIR